MLSRRLLGSAYRGVFSNAPVLSDVRSASSLIEKFDASVKKNPMREAVRYTKDNSKWSAEVFAAHVKHQGNAFIDLDYEVGTTITMWYPDSPEKHVLLTTAAKCGFKVFDVDFKINTVPQIRQFLRASQCNLFWFTAECDERGDDRDDIDLVRRAIPEFYEYDDTYGAYFHSKHYPNLRMFFHSGRRKLYQGAIGYAEMSNPCPPVDLLTPLSHSMSDDTPFYTKINPSADGKGIELEKTLTRGQVLDHPNWYFMKKIINQEYFEVNNGTTAPVDW
jgi:hypothetical protein